MHKMRHLTNRGQELAEFAIIVPFLLLITFGVLDLGRALHAAITVTNVAREGARFGVDVDWDDPFVPNPIQVGYNSVIAAAFAEAQDTALDLALMTVGADCGLCEEDAPLTVTVTYDFDFVMGIIPGFTITRFNTMMIP
jgi:hypothetical protein